MARKRIKGIVKADTDPELTEKKLDGLHYIAEQLRDLAVPITSVFQDQANNRLHDEANLCAVRNSILMFGQDQPLVVRIENRQIIKGNARHRAMMDLGYEYAAVVFVDDDKIEAARRSIADNRSAELGAWEIATLTKDLTQFRDDGGDLAMLGFSTEELALLLKSEELPAEQPEITPEIFPTPGYAKEWSVKISGIPEAEKDTVLEVVKAALERRGMKFQAKLS